MPLPLNPQDIAPCSARRVTSEFGVREKNGGWALEQIISWKNLEGDWDGTFRTLSEGLSEGEARAAADLLNGIQRKVAA